MNIKLRKNDIVKVMAGKDKGKSGKILQIFPAESKAIVEGINYVKKHRRRSQQDQTGGIIHKEAPIHLSKLAIVCSRCNRPARIGITVLTDGTKSRYCKRCEEIF